MKVRVLAKTGETVWDWGMMYKAVAHSVILYGSESWVVTGKMLKVLEGLHHWVTKWITGMKATCGVGGELEHPPVLAAMDTTGLNPIREYIRRRQATIAEKVACHPIYEICVEAERITGMKWMVR